MSSKYTNYLRMFVNDMSIPVEKRPAFEIYKYGISVYTKRFEFYINYGRMLHSSKRSFVWGYIWRHK